ncbi:disease resistance protein, partial [Mycobacterium marinum]
MPNLQEALQVALTVAPADAVEMATNLRDPWTAIGMLQQGRRWIEKALDAAPAEPTAARLRAIINVAMLAFFQVDMPTMAARQAEAGELLTTVTDPYALAHLNTNTAAFAMLRGELDLARSLAEQSLASADEFRVQIYARLVMIWTSAAANDAHTAVAHAEQGLVLSEAHGQDIVLRTYLLAGLAASRLALGQLDLAEHAVREGLQLSRTINDTITCATFLETSSWIAAAGNDPRRAAILMAAAAAVSR